MIIKNERHSFTLPPAPPLKKNIESHAPPPPRPTPTLDPPPPPQPATSIATTTTAAMISVHGFHTPQSVYDMAALAVRQAEEARQALELRQQAVLGPVPIEGAKQEQQFKALQTIETQPSQGREKKKIKALPGSTTAAPRRRTRSSPPADHVMTRSRGRRMTNKRKRGSCNA